METPTADSAEPFTRQEGLGSRTRAAVDGRGFHRLFGSVRLSASSDLTPVALVRAALLLLPDGAVGSRHTAALIWGGIVPPQPPRSVHVSVRDAALRRSRPGLQVHVLRTPDVRVRWGVPVTSPEQTFCDLSADLDLVDLVVLGDSLVRRGHTSPAALVAAATAFTGGRARLARQAAALVRPRVDSPMETKLRLLIVLSGLPEPVIDLHLVDQDGRLRFRLDLSYPDLRLAVEYDGRQHAESDRQWSWDVRRREHLDGLGWRLLVIRSGDMYRTPWQTVQRIAAVLAERGFEVEPDRTVQWEAAFLTGR